MYVYIFVYIYIHIYVYVPIYEICLYSCAVRIIFFPVCIDI